MDPRAATATGVAAALLALTSCGSRDDGLHEVTVSLGGVPDRPSEAVRVQLDGPTQLTLSMRTGEEAVAELPPGEYAVSLDEDGDLDGEVCPDRFTLGPGDQDLSLLWPVAEGSCPSGSPPDPPGQLPPPPDAPGQPPPGLSPSPRG